ncbi:MAG: hypothetical protein ACLFSE_13830 [Spirochaetia bacterium]
MIGELAANGHAVPEAGIVEAAGCVEITASRAGGLRVRALSDTGNP